MYVTGTTTSADFPFVNASLASQPRPSGTTVFVAKLNPAGTAAEFVSFFDGTPSIAAGLSLDETGNIYLTGTAPRGFPIVNGYDSGTQFGVFLTKINRTGTSILYSSLFGTDVYPAAVSADGAGRACVVGTARSGDSVRVVNGLQYAGGDSSWLSSDAFVMRFDTTKSGNDSLAFSSFLGGTGDDVANSVAIDTTGNCIVVGVTGSPDFPMRNAYQNSFLGGAVVTNFPNAPTPRQGDGFIAKMNPIGGPGETITFATYIGGTTLTM